MYDLLCQPHKAVETYRAYLDFALKQPEKFKTEIETTLIYIAMYDLEQGDIDAAVHGAEQLEQLNGDQAKLDKLREDIEKRRGRCATPEGEDQVMET